MENVVLLILGIVIIIIGIVNITGNVSTVHWYNRSKVKEEDIPKYGKAIGLGTLIIGVALLVDYVLVLLDLLHAVLFVLIPLIVIGLVFILYAQFKYNKGIF